MTFNFLKKYLRLASSGSHHNIDCHSVRIIGFPIDLSGADFQVFIDECHPSALSVIAIFRFHDPATGIINLHRPGIAGKRLRNVATLPAVIARLQTFEIDEFPVSVTFTRRLLRENGWSLLFTKRVIAEYKRFLVLPLVTAYPVIPADAVEQAWRLHLSYMHAYWHRLCDEVLGRPVHHEITSADREGESQYLSRDTATLQYYKFLFGLETGFSCIIKNR